MRSITADKRIKSSSSSSSGGKRTSGAMSKQHSIPTPIMNLEHAMVSEILSLACGQHLPGRQCEFAYNQFARRATSNFTVLTPVSAAAAAAAHLSIMARESTMTGFSDACRICIKLMARVRDSGFLIDAMRDLYQSS